MNIGGSRASPMNLACLLDRTPELVLFVIRNAAFFFFFVQVLILLSFLPVVVVAVLPPDWTRFCSFGLQFAVV